MKDKVVDRVRTNRRHNERLFFSKRAIEAMREIPNHALTVVEAPMGYGKTTAVREYLRRFAGRVLWQTIYDHSVYGFWKGFSGLFAKLDAQSAQNLDRLGFPDDSVLMHEALKIIETMAVAAPTVLVIDDYHLVANAATDRLIEFITRHEIPRLHIVVIARFIALPCLAELSLKGYLHHVTKEALEFWPGDIVAYYQLWGIPLEDSEVDMLYALTEGWISALYLLMLNFIAAGSFANTVKLDQLIEQAVYLPFPTEIKEFLLTVSVFDNFTLEQAVYMWGEKNSDAFLEEITHQNAFVKYDRSTKTYHIHSIFNNFLRDVYRRKDRDFQNAVYRKAGEWCLRNKDFFTAMHFFHLCGEFDVLLSILERSRSKSINSEHKERLVKYFEDCPAEVRAKHHLALLIYAIRLYTFNERELFQKIMAEVLRNIHADPALDQKSRDQLLGEYELILSFTKYNDINAMSVHHLKAGRLMNEPTAVIDENGVWTFGSPSVLYLFYRESGRLAQHVADMIEVMPHYYSLTHGHGTGAEHVMQAEWFFYQGDFGNAEIAVHKALSAVQAKRQTAITVCAVFLQARLALMRGDFSVTRDVFEKLRADILRHKEYIFLHTLDLCETYIYLAVNQPDRAADWVARGEFNSSRLFFPTIAMNNVIYGKTLLAKGEYLKLIGMSDQFNTLASIFPNLLAKIYNMIHLAAAKAAVLQHGEAVAALEEALQLAAPDKMYMPFVENCDVIRPLLAQVLQAGCYRETILRIFALYALYQKAVGRIIAEHFAATAPPLTPRERDIAFLAAEGLTNKQIGERLYISENTVKTQLKSIFKKTGVTSRALLKQSLDL